MEGGRGAFGTFDTYPPRHIFGLNRPKYPARRVLPLIIVVKCCLGRKKNTLRRTNKPSQPETHREARAGHATFA